MRKIIQPCGLHCMKIKHLSVSIGTQEILTDINLHIHCGTLNAVIGKNGAGKSTLVKAMLGDVPYTGRVEFKDREDGKLQQLKIGYVPQNINIEKHTPVSVYDLIACYQSRFPVFLSKKKICDCLRLHIPATYMFRYDQRHISQCNYMITSFY